jgi:predicted GIY-YIG superfamily endonuclease
MANGMPRTTTVRPNHYDKIRQRTHVLYRCFTRKKVLLYVGMTNDPEDRFKQHKAAQPWWNYVDHITLQRWPSRKALMEAEAVAIREERPKFNVNIPAGIYGERANFGRHVARLWPEVSAFSTYVPDHGWLIDQTLEQQLYPCTECKARAIKCVGDTVMCEICATEWTYDQWFAMTFSVLNSPEQLRLPI